MGKDKRKPESKFNHLGTGGELVCEMCKADEREEILNPHLSEELSGHRGSPVASGVAVSVARRVKELKIETRVERVMFTHLVYGKSRLQPTPDRTF